MKTLILAASLLATTMLSLPSTAHAQAMSADEAAAAPPAGAEEAEPTDAPVDDAEPGGHG